MLRMPYRLPLLVVAALLAPAPAVAQGTGFTEPALGFAAPLGDEGYDFLVETSFVPSVSGGYLWSIRDGSAQVGVVGSFVYSPLATDVEDWIDNADLYAGRLRVAGGVRLLVEEGNAYLFGQFQVGLDYVHAEWEVRFGPLVTDDDESDAGLALVPGLGFGYRFADWVGLTLRADFPWAFHWEDDDGGVDFDYESVDLEVAAGATFFF